jgi:hypothetical protein
MRPAAGQTSFHGLPFLEHNEAIAPGIGHNFHLFNVAEFLEMMAQSIDSVEIPMDSCKNIR